MAKSVNAILLILAAVLLVPAASHALGLGTITVRSALGQPLDAEIEVVAARPGDDIQVRLASREAYQNAGIDLSPALQGARFTIERRDGRTLIRVRTTQPVNDPFFSVLVELQSPTGRLARQYTVLVDPVEYKTASAPASQAAAPAAAPAVPPVAAAAPPRTPAPSSTAVAKAPTAAPAQAAPVVVAPQAPITATPAPAPMATPAPPPAPVAIQAPAPAQPLAVPTPIATPPPAQSAAALTPAPALAQPQLAAPQPAPAPASVAPVAAVTAPEPTSAKPTETAVPPVAAAPAPPAAAPAVPVVATQTPASESKASPAAKQIAATAAAPTPVAPATAAPATKEGADASDAYRIRRGDTLGAIARKWKPEGVTYEQMLVGLFQTNRPVFIRDNINLIRAGATIFIPGREDVLAISAVDAARQVRTHMAAFTRYRDTAVSAGAGSSRISQAQRETISRRVGGKKSTTRAM